MQREVTADGDLAAGVAVLVAQAIEDPPGRVALLGRSLLVVLQDRVDDAHERAELGLRSFDALAIAGRFGEGEDLVEDRCADPIVTPD